MSSIEISRRSGPNSREAAVRTVTVVIASAAGGDFLFRCLDSLRHQAETQRVPVIVVDRYGEPIRMRLKRDYSFVTVVQANEGNLSVPVLRRMGVNCVTTEIVAIIEEHCVAPANWLEVISKSFGKDDVAIGGPILDAGYDRLRDWVVYFSEYNNYLPPWPEDERFHLNGANIAYDREALLRHQEILVSGYWEVVLHPLLAREGRFRSVPNMAVSHTGPFDYGYYLGQRYLLSRVWGGTRRQSLSAFKRFVYLVLAPLLPFLLLGRIALRVLKSRRHIGKFVCCLPLLVPVMVAYVWGEWVGYLFGVGDALERVE